MTAVRSRLVVGMLVGALGGCGTTCDDLYCDDDDQDDVDARVLLVEVNGIDYQKGTVEVVAGCCAQPACVRPHGEDGGVEGCRVWMGEVCALKDESCTVRLTLPDGKTCDATSTVRYNHCGFYSERVAFLQPGYAAGVTKECYE